MPNTRSAALMLALGAAVVVGTAEARELTYGSWVPPRDVFNTKTLPAVFDQIKEDAKGSITWKLIAGGAVLDARGTVPGVKDGVADAGLGMVLAKAKERSITLNPGSAEVDEAIAAFAPKQRAANVEAAKKFGVKNAEAIMAAYLTAQERWRGLSKAIGRDVANMRDALMREVYDKLDYARF
ncbi:MAG TPA: hypothetical protein VG758_28430 [Hyphomicrobiaceae bacterium]|jgi:hypothetical protein|nr:hypothetical protein [Hyphomicrobiaceae bacterium]